VDVTEDARCGEGAACVGGACTAGACNVSDQCTAPNLCLDHQCGCASAATCDGGLCTDGGCAACADPGDDAACPSAYGAGFLCIAGSCKVASCRDDGECGGDLCCDNTCVSNDCCGIGDDGHCDAINPDFVCNAGGQCVCPDRPSGTVVVSDTGDDV